MSIEHNNDEDSVLARDSAIQAVVGDAPYLLVEIETGEDADESVARVSTNLNQEQVKDVLFGILTQLNQ